MTPVTYKTCVAASPEARAAVCAYLDSKGVKHTGRVSSATLGAVCGVDGRSWNRWGSGEREMPLMAMRLLELVTGIPYPPPLGWFKG